MLTKKVWRMVVPPVVYRLGWPIRVLLGLLALIILAVAVGGLAEGVRGPGDTGGDVALGPDEWPAEGPDEVTVPSAGSSIKGSSPGHPVTSPHPSRQPSPAAATRTNPDARRTTQAPKTQQQPPPQSYDNASLSVSASENCDYYDYAPSSGYFLRARLNLTVNASLSGAPYGNSPKLNGSAMSGSGSTSFSGTLVVDSGTSSVGSTSYTVRVTLPDGRTITRGGTSSGCEQYPI